MLPRSMPACPPVRRPAWQLHRSTSGAVTAPTAHVPVLVQHGHACAQPPWACASLSGDADGHGPPIAVILVEPQFGENIGAVARAMKNFNLSDLRLVSPRDGWPNQLAVAVASNAGDVIANATVHATVQDAIADLSYVYASTARSRFMNKGVVNTRELPSDIQLRMGQRIGFMFGRENSGLTNEEVALASKIVTIDAHPTYPVLNLAQAVVVTCYELFTSGALDALQGGGVAPMTHGSLQPGAEPAHNQALDADGAAAQPQPTAAAVWQPVTATEQARAARRGESATGANAASSSSSSSGGTTTSGSLQTGAAPQQQSPNQPGAVIGGGAKPLLTGEVATREQVEAFLERLVAALDAVEFFESPEKRPSTTVSIRNLITRVDGLTASEVKLLHGMLSRLHQGPKRAAAGNKEGPPAVRPRAA